jgi:hypothetical protein
LKQTVIATFLALGCSLGAFAQTPAATTVGGAIDRQVSLVENNVVNAAQAMPADKYNFTPESLDIKGANFKGVYTFAGLVKHIAATNYLLWSGTIGEKPPANVTDIKGPASMTSKAEIVQFLKDSFALGHRAANAMTAENAMDMVPGLGGQKMPRVFVVTFLLTHSFDEYGQMEEYLRMNGIIPPASAPKP